jgi:hypothetical protein
VTAAQRERSVLAIVQLQAFSVQCIDDTIRSMARALESATAVGGPGVICDDDSPGTSVAGTIYEGLKEAYLKAQDLSTTLTLVDRGTSNSLVTLWDSGERNHYTKIAAELRRDLCELIQTHKSGIRLKQEKDDLVRAHTALDNELRFVRSRLAEAELALRRKPSAYSASVAAAGPSASAPATLDAPAVTHRQVSAPSKGDAAVSFDSCNSRIKCFIKCENRMFNASLMVSSPRAPPLPLLL